jgi:drug/metabolite transporter (DMT)-like permease
MTHRWLAVLALFATAAAWGASFTLVKNVVATMAPEPFIFFRFTLAGLILLFVARRHLSRALLLPGLILGIFVFTGYLAQTHGLRFISAPRSAFLTGLYVILVPFFQWRTTGRPRLNVWIASLLAVIGTTILVGDGFTSGSILGDVLTLACAVIFALHVVYTARWSTSEGSAALAGIQVFVVGLAAAPLTLFARPTPWNTTLIAIILVTAIVTTAIAFAALMWAQAQVSATEAAVIFSFEPVAAAITSIAFEGEPLTRSFIAGGLMILAAMLLSQLRAR